MKRIWSALLIALLMPAFLVLDACDEWDDFIASIGPKGIYVGVVSFDGTTNGINKGYTDLVEQSRMSNALSSQKLMYLGKQQDLDDLLYVLGSYRRSSKTDTTPLYYAVNGVINDMEGYKQWLPKSVDNVTIVSFTAGRDQGSNSLAGEANNNDYGDKVKKKIRGGNASGSGQIDINGITIDAYAVAVKLSSNEDEQKKTLNRVSSGDWDTAWNADNPYVMIQSDWTGISNVFKGIASGLNSVKYSSDYVVTVAGPSVGGDEDSDNCNFAISFDGKKPLDGSNPSGYFLKGKMEQPGGKWKITGIEKTGVTYSKTEAVEVRRHHGVKVDFSFPGIGGFPANENVKAYTYGSSQWNEMTGTGAATRNKTRTEQKSAVIYLVLDATLPAADIDKIRDASKAFINEMYDLSKAK
ncbi:MAG: hypothetical protein LBH44_07825 [Treponema sp.]|nr:hypothetical protein [Treponema sp.]